MFFHTVDRAVVVLVVLPCHLITRLGWADIGDFVIADRFGECRFVLLVLFVLIVDIPKSLVIKASTQLNMRNSPLNMSFSP